mgnify:CR=1 FL=1
MKHKVHFQRTILDGAVNRDVSLGLLSLFWYKFPRLGKGERGKVKLVGHGARGTVTGNW